MTLKVGDSAIWYRATRSGGNSFLREYKKVSVVITRMPTVHKPRVCFNCELNGKQVKRSCEPENIEAIKK